MDPPRRPSVDELAENTPCDDPLSINYIRFLRFTMSLTGSWPYRAFNGRMHPLLHCSFTCLEFIAIVGQILYLKENYERLPFFDMCQLYITIFYSILASIRTLLPFFQTYGVILKEFLMIFHLVNFKHKAGYYQEIYTKIEWLSYRVVVGLTTSCFVGAHIFNVIPAVNNLRSGAYHDKNVTTEFSVYYQYPHFNIQEHNGAVTVCNVVIITIRALLVVSIDSLMVIIIFQIIGHIEILRYNLTQFPKSGSADIKTVQGSSRIPFVAVAMLNDQENFIFAEKIKQCVQHHIFIVKFTEKVSAFFGPLLAVYYAFYLVTLCIMLLEVSAGDTTSLIRYGPATAAMISLLVAFSTVFEVVKTKSESLVDALYSQDWASASVPNQRSMCVMLHRFQTPIVVKALGITPVNVQTMVEIIKTSFSYFAFLKTLDK